MFIPMHLWSNALVVNPCALQNAKCLPLLPRCMGLGRINLCVLGLMKRDDSEMVVI